jgi:CRISPR-associated protein Csd1
MILQSLVAYYEDLLEKGSISKPGWGKARVSYGLNLDRNGNIVGILTLKTPQEVRKKTVFVPQAIEVPQPVKRSSDVKTNFLCDNATYILGVDEKEKKDRALQCYRACKEMHVELLKEVESPAAEAIIQYFEKWGPEQAEENKCLTEHWDGLMAGGNILFYYDGKPVVDDEKIKRAWQRHYDKDKNQDDEKQMCIVTGEKMSIAKLHPSIKGVHGAQAMGTSLVSFNAPAFCSYEKMQGDNAPVGEYAAFAYATALNELLSDREHSKVIGDTTVVCWAEGGSTVYQDVGIAAMFGVGESSGITEQELSAVLEKARRGEPVEVREEWLDLEKHFYILGLAPNAARLIVRFFMKDSFGDIIRHINEHYDRLEIIRPVYDTFPKLPVWKLLSETVNKNAKDKSALPQMAADTLKAIITGARYPASLLNGVMLRIRAEHEVTRGKAAIIKAYYLRNKSGDCPEEVLKVGLNEECTNVPYTLGRLFAVLESVQRNANAGINTTIKDKYFNTAASTPAQIFPILINLAQKHLRKLKEGKRIYFSKRIGEMAEIIGEEFPKRLNLAEQGAFQLGYYCQTQHDFEKKEEVQDE